MKCLILLKPKLIQLDNILPIVFELKATGIELRPRFVAPNKTTFALIQRNPVLCDAIRDVNGTLSHLSSHPVRFLRVLPNLFVLRSFLFHKVISVETSVDYSPLTTLLSRWNRKVRGGKRVLALLTNQPARQFTANAESHEAIRRKRVVKRVRDYDHVIVSHSKSEIEAAGQVCLDPSCHVTRVGYTRGLPAWQRYVNESASRHLESLEGNDYFLFLVPGLGLGIPGETCAPSAVVFEECLSVLRDYNDRLVTVFRPHPVTDMRKMKEILDRTQYRNYMVSYIHPAILIRNARFVMTNGPSTLLSDAYFMSKPTLEYTDYDPRFLEASGGRSLAFDHSDSFINRDPEKLRRVFEGHLEGNGRVQRDPEKLRREFPRLKPEEIRKELWFFRDRPSQGASASSSLD